MTPFTDLVVIELAGSAAGAYAGKLFADFGAMVLKVEPPGGDPLRAVGERWRDAGTLFAYLNTSKRSVVLDVHTATGAALLEEMLTGADVVIESAAPQPLAPLTRESAHERLVKLYVSPFGLSGPYARYRSTYFTDYAAGGQMFLNGEPQREPIQGAGRQPEYQAGAHAFIGAMAALYARGRTGRGQTVDVSHMEGLASLHQWTTVRYTHSGTIQTRAGNRYATVHPVSIYRCRDGYVALSAASDEHAQRLLAVAGLGHLLADARFQTAVSRSLNAAALDEELEPWLLEQSVAEVVSLGQELRVPVGPVPGMLELLADPHLAARDFWATLPGDTLRYPGPPFRMSGHTWAPQQAPALGADTRAVLVGLGITQPQALREAGITREAAGDARAETAPVTRRAPSAQEARPTDGALSGVRVLDLSRVWAGPLAGRILGDLGADVIRVEATWSRGPKRPPEAAIRSSGRYPNNEAGARPWNREGMFNKFNRNKRAVTLQLERPEGKAIFERLVREADVVLENYSPRVMPQLGLGYERLRELNPGIIYIGMPGFGWSGPSRDWVALGTMVEPAAGLSSLMGYRDSGPYKSGVAWADPVAALNAATAILIALWDRAADPERRGQAIELSQQEAMIAFIGEEVLAAQVRGADPPRLGNYHPFQAPQGVYPCAGDRGQGTGDRWIALSVTDDTAWRSLCQVAGFDEELRALRLDQRLERREVLDAALAAWTCGLEHIALMHRLQQHGIAACAVLDAKELVEDPHLAARGFFASISHPDAGTHRFPGLPIHLSDTPATYRLPAPGLGEHNGEVFSGLLGMSAAELASLQAAGVIADEPPL